MNALLANCELVVVVLLTVCFALLMEPLLLLGILTLMRQGMRRKDQEQALAELQLAVENVKKSTRVSNLG